MQSLKGVIKINYTLWFIGHHNRAPTKDELAQLVENSVLQDDGRYNVPFEKMEEFAEEKKRFRQRMEGLI